MAEKHPSMALDPEEFLVQADVLAETGGEAACRSAINRAYYACHLLARDTLFGLDAARWEAGPRRPSHRAVIEAVRLHAPVEGIADELDTLKSMREVADYVRSDEHPELRYLFGAHHVSKWADLANEAVPRAREAFATLRLSLPESP